MSLVKNLQNIYESFFLPELYYKVISNKISVFKLLSLVSIIYALAISSKFLWITKTIDIEQPNSQIDTSLHHIIAQLPDLTLYNNKLLVNVPQPIDITDTNGNLIIIIDTRGHNNTLSNIKAKLLFTDTQLVYNLNGNSKIVKYMTLNPNNKTILINSEIITKLFTHFQSIIFSFSYLLLLPALFIAVIWKTCIKSFLLATLCLIYFKNRFKTLFNMFIVASLPLIILQTIYYLFPTIFIVPQISMQLFNFFYISFAIYNLFHYLKRTIVN